MTNKIPLTIQTTPVHFEDGVWLCIPDRCGILRPIYMLYRWGDPLIEWVDNAEGGETRSLGWRSV